MWALRARDIADRYAEGGIDSVIALGGETSAEEVEGVCGGGGDAAGDCTGDEGFDGLREGVREGAERAGYGTVAGELDAAVADVEELSRNVALPEALELFV